MIKTETAQPMKRRSNIELLNLYVSENNKILETDGNELYCKICKKSISYETKYLVHRHFKSKKHQEGTPNTTSKTENKPSKRVPENAGALETDGEMLFILNKKSISVDNLSSSQKLETQNFKTKSAQSTRRGRRDCINKHLLEENGKLPILEKTQDFCKTCLKQFPKSSKTCGKQNIMEKPIEYENNINIMELLISIQPEIKVEIKGNFPMFLCSECIQKLIVSYEFIEMYRNSNKTLQKILENFDDHEKQMEEIEVDKYENEIEQVDELPTKNLRAHKQVQDLSENADNEKLNSDDDWQPEKSCVHTSPKRYNSDDDDVTKKVFKGFFQPEENVDGSLTCQLCESILEGVLPWRKHIRENHLEEKPKRAYNKRTTEPRSKGLQKVHRKMLPNAMGLYQCEYCEKSYPKYLFYRRHLRIHTEGTHLCIECGKSFSNITSYNSHMLRHKGEKKFECSKCPKSFVCPSDLYGHMMTHTDNKPYVCDVCGAAFRMPYQLRNHNRIHTGIKNYKCEYCEMRFKSRPNQICHMRTHTGEKPFHCKYCERAFSQSGDCVKHMRKHLGDNNVYQCDLCPLRFPLVRDLRAHFASHKDDDEETRNRNLQARIKEEQNLKIKLAPEMY